MTVTRASQNQTSMTPMQKRDQNTTKPVYAASAQSNTTAGKRAATLPQTNENTNQAWVVLGLGLLVLALVAGSLTVVADKKSHNN